MLPQPIIDSINDNVRKATNVSVTAKDAGDTPAPDQEQAAIFNSIAQNLLLRPKAVLYLFLLARNSLLNTCINELTNIDTLTQTILDLGNVTLDITEVQDLLDANNALTELSTLDTVNTESAAYIRYNNSINDFLNNQLSKNVKTSNSTTLQRPSAEALKSLGIDYSTLVISHIDLVDRLNALVVGVDNFKSSNLQTLLGQLAITRAKSDLGDIINILQTDTSGSSSQDITIRLITSKAAIKASADFSSIDDLLLDDSHPIGYSEVTVTSEPGAAIISTPSTAPFTQHAGWTISYSDGAVAINSPFPQTDHDYGGFGWLASGAVTYPVTIPISSSFYIINGTSPVPPSLPLTPGTSWVSATEVDITTGSRTISQIIADINLIGGSDFAAREYIKAGTSRIVIYSLTQSSISLTNTLTTISTSIGGVTTATTLSNSCHVLCGFNIQDTGTTSPKIQDLVDAFNVIFPTVAICTSNPSNSTLIFTSVRTDPGITITMSADDTGSHQPFGFSTIITHTQSTGLSLSGLINNTEINIIDPSQIFDPGDLATINGAQYIIDVVTTTDFTLISSVNTVIQSTITVDSAVKFAADNLANLLTTFISSWNQGPYVANLNTLDTLIAGLSGSVSLAQINNAISTLTDLRSNISTLVSLLQTSNTNLPSNAGSEEKIVINGIIATLQERNYDKALDFFLRCKVIEMFELDWQTSSYGGSVMNSMSDIAKSDIFFPGKSTPNPRVP